MSSEIALSISNVSKCYHIYDEPRDRLKQFVLPRLRRLAGAAANNYYHEFWALKNVSFEVAKGEAVGIIGRNGSGKSTLLQIICGTLNPSSGQVTSHGRIAALLELGSGFNPEFTGRENVYLNGTVLGLRREEIDRRFDDIARFAEIGEFIEQPVKTYSSGMLVRLAFSVAVNVDPEILIVDEALAVGDELFQRKCFSKIESIRAAGATILFVSHSGHQIIELCDRAVLLDSGDQLAVGRPKQMVERYQKLLYAPADRRAALRAEIRQSAAELNQPDTTRNNADSSAGADDARQSTGEHYDPNLVPSSTIDYAPNGAQISNPEILTMAGERVNNLISGNSYRYRYTVRFQRRCDNVRFGMLIKTISGLELGGAASSLKIDDGQIIKQDGAAWLVEFRFCCALNTGMYFLNAGVVGDVDGSEGYLHRLIDIAMFRVLPETGTTATGTVDFSCHVFAKAITE